ncbi:MAG: Asp-tRNA(Asn)/Glu-tRNA(Gln) amidotransferase subunit GatA [Methanosarcinaceae archaeon]|jgi:aspartyl-tRNA(Asn)/glutamyl-tRNA(Gln) amidotransferase subunit A|nr:Asp-tRNA(Asn)/Glu-tRNA(Gln) amidotransferase subunit GatA [Methanosarcinaceae archaeon]NKQ38859.1 Asp-tRNA(Asn)/Glu-tRNA(Gln) amidotransferase subunit GatA [Methanosarcinales archaeon]
MELNTISSVKKRIKESSAKPIIEEILKKIEKSKINGFVTINKNAINRAEEIDNDRDCKDLKLKGVPIAIKDNISTKGIETTCSSQILKGYVPPYDAHIIEKLINAGAIIIGKTNMDEFAMGNSTETSYFGTTLNPHDHTCVPGGSSGGSAAVVSAKEVPVSIGSDTGGSVRCPASFCGVVGFKPTYGMVSRYGLISYANSLEQIGPIAETVEDIAILMDVIGGYDEKDSTSINKTIQYEESLKEDFVGLKIGIPKEYFAEGIDEGVEKLIWKSIQKYENMDCSWEEVSLPHTKHALASYYIIAMSEASSNLARFDGTRFGMREEGNTWGSMAANTRAKGFGKEVKCRVMLGTYALSAGYYSKYYLKAMKVRTLVKNDFERAFSKVDVLMTPTMPKTAFKIGEIQDPISSYMMDVNTVPINLAGVPSISIPCGLLNKLPVGLQIIGKHFDETKILQTANAFEVN